MASEWDSIIDTVAPILQIGGKFLANKSAIDSQVGDYSAAARASADTLNKGYDDRLAQYELGYDEIQNLLKQGLGDVSNITRTGVYDYEDASKRNVDQYAKNIRPVLGELTQGLTAANDLYGLQLDEAIGQSTDTLQQGANEYEQKLAPYTQTGAEALDYLRSILGSNPNELTPQQKILLEDLTRDSRANLAASGLRGAGRSGVATINDARAKAMAELYDQNQRRIDSAATTLNSQGYQATGNVANTLNALKKSIADMQLRSGESKANTGLNTNQKIAETAFNVGSDIGAKGYATGQDVAGKKLSTSRDIGNLTNTYYQNTANLTGDKYAARGNTAFGKATVDSTAGAKIADQQYQADDQIRQQMGSAIDKLGSLITTKQSQQAKTGGK